MAQADVALKDEDPATNLADISTLVSGCMANDARERQISGGGAPRGTQQLDSSRRRGRSKRAEGNITQRMCCSK